MKIRNYIKPTALAALGSLALISTPATASDTLAQVTADSQTFTACFEEYDGQEWILIGRGREGWQFTSAGMGSPGDVAIDAGTTAAFTPKYFSDAIVNDLLDQSGITDVGDATIRISRASDTTGTVEFQEIIWTNLTGNGQNWTWDFDNPTAYTGITYEYKNAPAGLPGASIVTYTNQSSHDSNNGNAAQRLFTWPWGGHGGQQGFSYGQTVTAGTNSPTNFLWENGTENHSLPYTEVWIPFVSGPDLDPPVVESTDPADNSGGVNPNGKLTATFDEAVQLVSGGAIYLTDLTDGSGNTTIAANDLSQTWVDTSTDPNSVVISPTGGLEFGTTYAVTFGQGNTISDFFTTANFWADTTWDTSSWNVTTEAFSAVAPVLTPTTPADGATGVAADTTLLATYDQQILIGSGNITIKVVGGGTLSTIAVTDASQVALVGTTQLLITPASALPGTTQIAVQFDAGVVTNYSLTGNAAITDETTWNFETGDTRDLVWDPSGGGPGSDGSGTWLGAGEWWDTATSSNVNWVNGFPDNATIGSGGTGGTISLAGDVTVGDATIDNYTGRYVFENGTITVNGTLTWGPNNTPSGTTDGVEFKNTTGIAGTGDIVANGNYPFDKSTGQFNIRTVAGVNNTFSGNWIVQNGVLFTEPASNNAVPDPSSTIILDGKAGATNGAVYSSRWGQTLDRPLGTGSGEIQVIGNRSGFEGQGTSGLAVRLDGPGNQQVTWGTTDFNPSVLVLQTPNANSNANVNFDTAVDLNGATRTIEVDHDHGNGIGNSSFNDGRGQMSRAITNADTSTTAGLIKEGPGNLWFANVNTYDGGLTVNEGGVRFDRAAALPSTGTHTFNTGIELQVNIGSGDDFTLAAGTAAGSLGGLLAGTGPGTSTTVFNGDHTLTLRGSGTVLSDIPNLDAGGTTSLWLIDGDKTLSGNNTFSGALGVSYRGGTARTVTLGSSTALAGAPSAVIDSSAASKLDLAGFDATVGDVQVGSNNGGQQGQIDDTVGGGTLTLLGDVTLDGHNNGAGAIHVDTLDLGGGTRTFNLINSNNLASSLTISSVIQNGAVIVDSTSNNGRVKFTAVNTYSGDTTILDGVLSIDNAYLANSSEVFINSGAIIDLNFVGTDTISELWLGGVAQGPGVYDNTSPFITGSGTLTVGAAGTSAFNTWAASNGVPADSEGTDSDTGGLNNLGEFGLGGDPTDGNDDGSLLHTFSANVAGGAEEEGILTIAVRNAAVGLFSTADPSVSAAADGIVYTVAADTAPDVGGGGLTVTPTMPAVTTGLPAAPAGYTYVSFYVSGPEGYFQVTVAPE